MELYHQILAEYLAMFGCPGVEIDGTKIILDRCYQAICQIKMTLEDESLNDSECFQKIESIVSVLEELGLNAGARHDFG